MHRAVFVLRAMPGGRRRATTRYLAVAAVFALLASSLSASRPPQPAAKPVPTPVAFVNCGEATASAGVAAALTSSKAEYQEIMLPTDPAPRRISYAGATVTVTPKALRLPTGIGITPLNAGQLPKLDSGMTNVTGKRRGYRFTPHPITFTEAITVTLPYDPTLLVDGFTAQDVYTYFHDDVAQCWQVLDRVSLDEVNHTVTSLTDHFTDMINATVTVPEHPEGVSFNPNQIKGIQAADPGAGVNLISPGTPGNLGDNVVSYPIEVPAGRAGLQPQLAVAYTSAGENSWMGMGWDLATQAVMIDTRWGVPRYSTGSETETYALNGEQLTPVAHRGTTFLPRTAEKVFHTRAEGGFARIVRHGDGPTAYSWEVTDKAGTRFLYGGGSAADPATLADATGNVYMWALREVRDVHGNTMRYRYILVDDFGVAAGVEPGRNLYLQKITYTGRNGTEGKYAVTFFRDRELGEQLRVDKSIDARGGFKRVTADLLRRIDVTFDGSLIRRYGFDYKTGAFFKTLLSSLSQYDKDGTLFNTHHFDYFDDIRDDNGTYQAFQQATWTVPGDGLSTAALNLTPNSAGDASAVNANTSLGGGGHLYVGVGTAAGKSTSIGVKVGFSHSENNGLLALVDVDGDNLPDKVFKDGGSVRYRKNLSGPAGQLRFEDQLRTLNLPGINGESSNSLTLGIEGYLSGVAAQLDYVNTFSSNSQYFSDVNGDGIIDLVNGTSVLFGWIGAGGTPVYGLSGDTPVPVGTGTVDTTGLFDNFTQDRERMDQSFPLLDSVRRWVAPFAGTVKVEGQVSLSASTATARAASNTADGVRVAIQHESTELWSDTIAANDNTAHAPSGVDSITVARGARLYFRVQSGDDGGLDEVSWDPKVSYQGVTNSLDVNGLSSYVYQASDDFTLAGRRADIKVPLTGTLHIEGDLHKAGTTTDDVTAVITRDGTPVFQQTLSGSSTNADIPVNLDIPVQQGQLLKWRIRVDSPIDVGQLTWTPHAFYTAATGVDKLTDNAGRPLVVVDAPYDLDIYPVDGLTAPQGFFHVNATTTLTVNPALSFNFGTAHPTATIAFTVKSRDGLLAKRSIQVTNGVLTPPASFAVTVQAGDDLFFDFSTLDDQRDPRNILRLRDFLLGASVSVTPSGGTPIAVPSAFHGTAEEAAFPQPYRGWAAVGYNGNARKTLPIVQNDLVVDENFGDQLPDDVDSHKDEFTADPRIDPPKVTPFRPSPQNLRWESGEHSWVGPAGASSSRMGVDSIRLPRPSDFAGGSAVPRLSRSDQISLTGSVGGGPGTIGGSTASGDSTGQVDFLDMNGDHFPDVVGAGGVQYTDPNGALSDKHGPMLDGAVRKSSNSSGGISAGSAARTITTGRGHAASPGHTTSNTADAGSELPPFSVGGSWGSNSADGTFDLLDINGDSLPDRVYSDGRSALNLGYRFGEAESWRNPAALNEGTGSNFGLSIGFNTDFYGFAGGASYSESNSSTHKTMMDVNGDGLLDRVFDTNPITVSLNTGNGFEPGVPFNGSFSGINGDKNTTLGGGVYFTFSICFIAVCIIINPGGNISGGASRSEQVLRDINGDGYTDHLRSTRDNQLIVAENQTGRTNLLASVSRPMGGLLEFDYTRDGNTYDLPQSRWLLTKVAANDGHPGDGQDVQLTTYEYAGPSFDRLEREFHGYATVIARHRDPGNGGAVYRTITREFRTDGYYTRGLVTRELTTDAAGNKFLETVNTYSLRDVADPTATADPRSTTATIFAQLVRTDKKFYEGQAVPGKSTFTTMEYDALGNTTRSFDAADTGSADDVDTRIQYTADDPACQSAYIVGAPDVIDVIAGGTTMRHRESTVDCTTGNLTQVRARLVSGTDAVTDMTYFDNGNLRSVTNPPNEAGQRYRLEYVYDSTVDTYVESITDSFGLQSTSTHDFKFGVEDSTTDFNDQVIRNTYDAVGRLDTVVGPYESGSQITIDFDYHPEADVPYAITRHIDKDANGTVRPDTLDTITFTDGLKRAVQVKTDATVFTTADTPAADVMIVSGRIVYDFLGRTVEQFYPNTEPKGAGNITFNPDADDVQPTTFTYDVQNRATRTVFPDDTFATTSYGFGPDRAGTTQFETIVTDPNGKSKRTYTDVRQLTTAVKEFNPAGGHPVIWTSFAYDPMKQITTVIDDHNNTTTAEYDNFGRRTAATNPDTGRTQTVYDLAGHPIRKITAKLAQTSQSVAYDYEFNRLARIRYPIFTANNVTYTYGAPGAANNSAGRITNVTDGAGIVAREYGPLGEVVKETRTSPAQGSHIQTFTTQYKYDTWNRMQQITYPDGEVLTYHYSSGGLVDRADGVKGNFTYDYLTRMDYDKFGQKALVETGNGTRTQYTFDAEDRRLTNLKANLAQGYVFQNLDYTYDNTGNITTIENDTVAPSGPEVGMQVGGPSTQHFAYDDLYQLIHADGSYAPRTPRVDRYNLNLTYDSIHNITNKNQLHELVSDGNAIVEGKLTYNNTYTYAGSRPHAPTSLGIFTLQYDANGNQISRAQQPKPRQQLIWDEDNRLACSHENVQSTTLPQTPASCDNAGGTPNEARYYYDDEGNRVVKDGAQFHVYPNQNFSTNGIKQYKHIYIGTTKLLTKFVEPAMRIEDRQFYSHGDHLNSTGFVTDVDGGLAEHIKYFPAGETWVSEHPSQPVPQQYTAQEIDPETGFYYMGARYYDPRTQLWKTPDPILGSYLDGRPNGGVFNGANLALYTYTYNNPVRLVDPTGTDPSEGSGTPRLFAAVSDWIRDWVPGLIAAPLAGLVDVAGGLAEAIGGIATLSGSSILGGLANMGKGALAMVGLKEFFDFPWINPRDEGVRTTSTPMPRRLAKDVYEAGEVQQVLAPDARDNGMHAWHAATNAHLANRLGPIGAPLLWLAGLYHETFDFGSVSAEQDNQGTVNHILDSTMDIVANTWGILLGLILPRRLAVGAAAITGDYIPGPGDPDPVVGGTGTYHGRPWDAWGPYRRRP